jgi:DHA3 family multidrug efflux protein-like MFS transporter
MGALGALFTIRESWILYAAGIWLYMTLIPAMEAAEQTVIQKVVPFHTQGRVFGFASAFEAAAAPITAFLIAPLAEFLIIPYMNSDAGRSTWGWVLGGGETRGIALVFLFAGAIMIVVALLAFLTKSYRVLSATYAGQKESVMPAEVDGADLDAESAGTR